MKALIDEDVKGFQEFREETARDLVKLPSKIHSCDLKILKKQNKINELNQNIEEIEARIYMRVRNKVDDDGKQVFKNVADRDNQVLIEKKQDKNFNESLGVLQDLKTEVEVLKCERSFYLNEMSAFKAVVKMEDF